MANTHCNIVYGLHNSDGFLHWLLFIMRPTHGRGFFSLLLIPIYGWCIKERALAYSLPQCNGVNMTLKCVNCSINDFRLFLRSFVHICIIQVWLQYGVLVPVVVQSKISSLMHSQTNELNEKFFLSFHHSHKHWKHLTHKQLFPIGISKLQKALKSEFK